MANYRIELDHEAVGKLLKSPEMVAELRKRAERIAAAAGDGFEVETSVSRTRAHALVRTATFKARHAEARDRALTRALDAGR